MSVEKAKLNLKERVIDEALPYKEIVIKTKLKDGSVVEGKSIKLTNEVTAEQIISILTEQEVLKFLKNGVNIEINNMDRRALRPAVNYIDKIVKLLEEGKITREELLKILQ